jgi:hypothetical protein
VQLSAETLRPIYERNNRNAQRTADELAIPVTTLKSSKAYREIRSPFVVTGRSTLKNLQTGEDVMVWEKESLDKQAERECQLAAFEALAAKLPRLPPSKAPATANRQLATLYTLTDAHVGALCWHKEGGADWDLEIAEKTLVGCFEAMVRSAPDSELGIVNQLGDFLHWDGLQAVTPTSGHLLDADGRFEKLVEVAIRILRRVIGLALAKHSRVHVILAEGNHDLASSVWLRKMFAALYEDEPRVTVDDSALPYYVLQHGKTMLAFHHGHLKKNDGLPLLFAAQFPKMWGDTVKRYCHVGHRHHYEGKMHSGMTVTQHSTLAARDAYAARGGWINEREARAITYHAEFGQVAENIVSPEMLAA